jgi:exonuclease SbcC
MLIRSLEIENYRVIRSARIVLPAAVIGIIGPNGAGKTSLIEAIAWALYGTGAARSGKDQIAAELAAPEELCRVAVVFDIHGAGYEVERRLVGRSRRAEVTVAAADGTLLATGVNDAGAFVAKLFGLDFKGFLTSFLARQQELNAFSDLVPSKRREHLATMLGVDRLDRAITELRSDSRVHQAGIGVLQSNLEHRADLATELEALDKRLQDLEKTRLATAGARDIARQELDRQSALYTAEQARKDQCSVIEGRLQGARSSLKHLQERRLQLEHEAAELTGLASRAAALKAETEPLPDLHRQRDSLLEQKKNAALREELNRQAADLAGRQKQIEQHLVLTRTQQEEDLKRLASMPEHSEAKPAELEARLEQARAKFTDSTASLRSVVTDQTRLTERLADMQSVGEAAACDRCGRPFGDDLASIRDHFRAELESCQTEIKRLTADQQAVRRQGEALAAELKQVRAELECRRELEREQALKINRIAELTAQTNDLTDQQTAIAGKLAEVVGEPFDPAALETVLAELTRLENKEAEHNRLLGRLQRQPVVADELRQNAATVERAAHEQAELEREQAEIGYNPEQFAAAARALQAAQAAFDTAAKQAADSRRDHDLAAREIEIKNKQLADFAETESRLEQMRETVFYGEKLQSLFKQFRTSVIANIRPSLAAISSRLMADMTDGRYSLLELDDQYNLLVMDNGRFFPVERFSGGEKDLANLCLRLAISQALTDAAGIDSAFVILDEIFGSQDDGRRELIFDGLAGLKRRFAQIVLVTHIEEIKNRVECLIEVRPGADGWSEVIVHG